MANPGEWRRRTVSTEESAVSMAAARPRLLLALGVPRPYLLSMAIHPFLHP